MADEFFIALSVLKTLTVALGLYVVYLGARAYRRRRQAGVLWLTIALAVLTLAAIAEGILVQLTDDLEQSRLVEAGVTLAGFGVLVYALYAK